MNHQNRVMLLIDADNVTADVIEQAYERVMQAHGAIHVRRAYCTAELAAKHLKLFKALSIRPMVNVSTGKNSTDIALAVDALDLVLAERPDVVVLVSSDSDFAPLVIRLREKGCRVEGIGQEGKTGDDSKPVYDNFVDIPHRKGKAAAKAPAKRAGSRSKAAVAAQPEPEVEVEFAVDRAPPPVRGAEPPRAPARGRGRGASRAAAPAPVAAPAAASASAPAHLPRARSATSVPDDVRRILAALPELLNGDKMQLNLAKERLCDADLLSKNAPSTKLFKNHPTLFMLTPDTQPNKVQYLGPRHP